MLEPFLNGLDCSDLEWKLHDGALVHGVLEQSADESWLASSRTRVSGHLHNYRGSGVEGFGQEVDSSGVWTTFVLSAICCADDVVWAAAWVAAAEVMVAEVIEILLCSGDW